MNFEVGNFALAQNPRMIYRCVLFFVKVKRGQCCTNNLLGQRWSNNSFMKSLADYWLSIAAHNVSILWKAKAKLHHKLYCQHVKEVIIVNILKRRSHHRTVVTEETWGYINTIHMHKLFIRYAMKTDWVSTTAGKNNFSIINGDS